MLRARRPSRVLSAMLAAATGLTLALAGTAGPAAAAPKPTTLRKDGIGPLFIGMRRSSAVKTGWLSGRGTGCPLAGPPLPITYVLRGPKAPAALRATAQFEGERLTVMTFSRGVRTTKGVTIGTTLSRTASRFRTSGYRVRQTRSATFGGTFLQAYTGTNPAIAAFSPGSGGRITELAIPAIPLCE